MTTADTPLILTTTVDNDRAAPRASLRPLARDINLSIEYDEEHERFDVRAWGDSTFPPNGQQYLGRIDLSAHDLYGAIASCREVWKQSVIDLRVQRAGGSDLPYQDRWDLSSRDDRAHLQSAGLRLAREGKDLFDLLFGRGDDGLHEIGALLTAALRRRECVITIHSADCFVPWQMLYTPPDPETDLDRADAVWQMNGFWGHRHVLEQQLPIRRIGNAISVDGGTLQVGLNLDRRIDEEFGIPFAESIDTFFSSRNGVAKTVRETKETLRRDIRTDRYTDHISYFGCHGTVGAAAGDQPSFALTDRDPIRQTDLLKWFTAHSMRSSPIVFVNTCEGGQMSSLFYNSFSQVLLSSGANCLIGAQTDLPAVFALEFAQRFFVEFLAANERVGEILRRLTRHFADEHGNPLALVYSLYHGLDTHLAGPVT
jgi:hypothetical protein